VPSILGLMLSLLREQLVFAPNIDLRRPPRQ
jgi:hypothetical protein